jgi:hypothetical protein
MERVEDPLGEKKIPWFNRNCYRMGQDLVSKYVNKLDKISRKHK